MQRQLFLYPDQARQNDWADRIAGPDLGTNSLQRLSGDETQVTFIAGKELISVMTKFTYILLNAVHSHQLSFDQVPQLFAEVQLVVIPNIKALGIVVSDSDLYKSDWTLHFSAI